MKEFYERRLRLCADITLYWKTYKRDQELGPGTNTHLLPTSPSSQRHHESTDRMSTLFEPIKIGNLELSHRVVLAPLTRMRTLPSGGIKTDLVKEYYEQRASVPGTLLITEGTFITEQAAGFPGVPGFYSEEQIDAWKQVCTVSLVVLTRRVVDDYYPLV